MARKSKPATTTKPDEPSTGRGRQPTRHKSEKPKPEKKRKGAVQIVSQDEVSEETSDLTKTLHTPTEPVASSEIEPKTPAGEPVVLNTCTETLREPDPDAPVNINWTELERRDMADAFTTVERRRGIMEQTAEAARIAKKAYDSAVDIWFEKSKAVMHGQPEIDPKTGQRNMFPAVPATADAAANNGVLARIGGAPATDDEIRHVISQFCEGTVWSKDLSRAGLTSGCSVVLDRANIRKPGELLLLAARRGVRWWKDLGLAESEARTVMHRALACVVTFNDDCLPAVRALLGSHLSDQINATGEGEGEIAWQSLMAVTLDDKALVQTVPTQSRERFERAAGHLTNAGIADIGTASMLLHHEPQWWFTRFPGIESEALDIEIFASALPLAMQEWARLNLLMDRSEPSSIAQDREAAGEHDRELDEQNDTDSD